MASIINLDVIQLEELFDYLATEDFRNLSLTCKPLSEIAQPALFEKIKLWFTYGSCDSTIPELLSTLKSKQHLANRVRRVAVCVTVRPHSYYFRSDCDAHQASNIYANEVAAVMKLCPRIHTLEIPNSFRDLFVHSNPGILDDEHSDPDDRMPRAIDSGSSGPPGWWTFSPIETYGNLRLLDVHVPQAFKYSLVPDPEPAMLSSSLTHNLVQLSSLTTMLKAVPRLESFTYHMLCYQAKDFRPTLLRRRSHCSPDRMSKDPTEPLSERHNLWDRSPVRRDSRFGGSQRQSQAHPVLNVSGLVNSIQHCQNSLRHLEIRLAWWPIKGQRDSYCRDTRYEDVGPGIEGHLGSLTTFTALKTLELPVMLLVRMPSGLLLKSLLPGNLESLGFRDDVASREARPCVISVFGEQLTDLLEHRASALPQLNYISFDVYQGSKGWAQDIWSDRRNASRTDRLGNAIRDGMGGGRAGRFGNRGDRWEQSIWPKMARAADSWSRLWKSEMTILAKLVGWRVYWFDVKDDLDNCQRIEIHG